MTSGVKRPSYRRIFGMAIPIILQSSISSCATLVDNLMVGSLGSGVISGVATTCNPTKIVTETFGDIYDVVFENITVCKHSAVTTDGPGEPIREMVNPLSAISVQSTGLLLCRSPAASLPFAVPEIHLPRCRSVNFDRSTRLCLAVSRSAVTFSVLQSKMPPV